MPFASARLCAQEYPLSDCRKIETEAVLPRGLTGGPAPPFWPFRPGAWMTVMVIAGILATTAAAARAAAPDYRYGYWVPYVDSAHYGPGGTYNSLSLSAFDRATRLAAGDEEAGLPAWGSVSITPPTLREGLHVRSDRPLSAVYDFWNRSGGGESDFYRDGYLSYALSEDSLLGTEYWVPTQSTEVSVMATENFTEVTFADTTITLHKGETVRLPGVVSGARISADRRVAVVAVNYEDDHYSATWAYQVPAADRVGRVYCIPRAHPHAYRNSVDASRVCLLAITDGTEIRMGNAVVSLDRGQHAELPLTGEVTLEGNYSFYAVAIIDVIGRDPLTDTDRHYAYALVPLPPEAGLRTVIQARAETSGGLDWPFTELAVTSLDHRNVIRLLVPGAADIELSLDRGETRYFHEGEIAGWTEAPLRIESIRAIQVVHSVRSWWGGISGFATGEVLPGIPLSGIDDESVSTATSLPERRYFLFAPAVSGQPGGRLYDLLAPLGQPGTGRWRGFGFHNGHIVENPPAGTGLAYWLACALPPQSVALRGTPRRRLWTVDLRAGWNLVALPTSPADWPSTRILDRYGEYTLGDTSLACPVDPVALWYRDETADLKNNGGWVPVLAGDTSVPENPWGGYCLWSSDSTATMVVWEPGGSTPTAIRNGPVRASSVMAAGWKLDLAVESEDSRDAGACVGVREGSRTGWDRKDVRKPPRPGSGAELSVIQVGRGFPGTAFDRSTAPAVDPTTSIEPAASEFLQAFDAPGSDTYEWTLLIRGDGPLATLTCTGTERLPSGWQVSLIDPTAGRAVDLLRTGSHRFALGGAREFTIRVGASPPGGYTWTPARTSLTRLTPNPAAGPVTLEYSLSQAVRVRVDIFDVQGRRVSVLDEGVRDAGLYSLTWRASDTATGPGVFFVRFQAGDVIERRKVVLLR